MRHQRLQSHLCYNGLFGSDDGTSPKATRASVAIRLAKTELSKEVIGVIMELDPLALVAKWVKFRGLCYREGHLLVLSKCRRTENLTVGKILQCAVFSEATVTGHFGFVCRVYEASLHQYGYYTLGQQDGLKVIMLRDIMDSQPLSEVVLKNVKCFCLHHFVSQLK